MANKQERIFRGHKFFTEIIHNEDDNKDYECMTVADFAKATGKHVSQVHLYMRKFPNITPLKVIRIINKPFIPVSELCDFVFTTNSIMTYHYNAAGEKVFTDKGIEKIVE